MGNQAQVRGGSFSGGSDSKSKDISSNGGGQGAGGNRGNGRGGKGGGSKGSGGGGGRGGVSKISGTSGTVGGKRGGGAGGDASRGGRVTARHNSQIPSVKVCEITTVIHTLEGNLPSMPTSSLMKLQGTSFQGSPLTNQLLPENVNMMLGQIEGLKLTVKTTHSKVMTTYNPPNGRAPNNNNLKQNSTTHQKPQESKGQNVPKQITQTKRVSTGGLRKKVQTK
ncbi:hypothetical protein BY996DRAFT_3583488 [Phakopsora pachyrhizi]|uniref:Expressed protein n=1 Tax=Phakopsora pachyrhizi TaxID=170000 RepID=A0AAV0AVG6_PHAPC|nr:hypothetical protein BY996DRAFT_3583488 [Phakopsora pachyrhizi]CAH7673674.1 expressed protein [Phakopsora pachyrhizi]